jgi:hypothetical protein
MPRPERPLPLKASEAIVRTGELLQSRVDDDQSQGQEPLLLVTHHAGPRMEVF